MNKALEIPHNQRLHIDEEGYPVVQGARIDDQDSLNEIFLNLKRVDSGDQKSALVTTWGGVQVWVEAFSAPLVVQKIERKNSSYVAYVPGSVSHAFNVSELQIDEWGRLHFFTKDFLIEAVFSRKAQADFLLGLEKEIRFGSFRENQNPVSESSFWTNAYESSGDGWDLGRCSPSFKDLASRFLVSKKLPSNRVLVPGAGRGYEAQWLSDLGLDVVAEDFSAKAKEEFLRLNPDSRVDYKNRDFFGQESLSDAPYGAICEFIFFCAIDPSKRKKYFDVVAARLDKNGLLLGIFLVMNSPGGPPYSVTPWELREYFKERFDLVHWKTSEHSVSKRQGKEFELVLKKK